MNDKPDWADAATKNYQKGKADGYRMGANKYFMPDSVLAMKTTETTISEEADKIEKGEVGIEGQEPEQFIAAMSDALRKAKADERGEISDSLRELMFSMKNGNDRALLDDFIENLKGEVVR